MIGAFWILIAFLLIAGGLFIFTQGGQNLGPAIATIGVVILLILFVGPARGHDHGRVLSPWYQQLKSGKGPCCDGSDYNHVADVDWKRDGGHYQVRLEGQWVDVPDEAVLTGPNLDGRTLVWPTWSNGLRAIRCFLPGVMM